MKLPEVSRNFLASLILICTVALIGTFMAHNYNVEILALQVEHERAMLFAQAVQFLAQTADNMHVRECQFRFELAAFWAQTSGLVPTPEGFEQR